MLLIFFTTQPVLSAPIVKDVGLVVSSNILTTFGLTSGGWYQLYVTAYNQTAESGPSNTATFTYNTVAGTNTCNPCIATWSPNPGDVVTGYKLYLTPIVTPQALTTLIVK